VKQNNAKKKSETMRQLVLVGAVSVALVVAGLTWAFIRLPWWQSVALVVAIAILAKLLAGRVFTWALSLPFKWKGAVLNDAAIEVHSVAPAALSPGMPSRNVEESPASNGQLELSSREFFQLDVTITPNRQKGKFIHWGPNDLVLVKPETKLRLYGSDDHDESCQIKRIEVEQEGQFKEDEGLAYAGPQRLRLLLAVQPGVEQLKFRYYFEEFGKVELPLRPAAGRERDQAA
jgi:hypothetical protein